MNIHPRTRKHIARHTLGLVAWTLDGLDPRTRTTDHRTTAICLGAILGGAATALLFVPGVFANLVAAFVFQLVFNLLRVRARA